MSLMVSFEGSRGPQEKSRPAARATSRKSGCAEEESAGSALARGGMDGDLLQPAIAITRTARRPGRDRAARPVIGPILRWNSTSADAAEHYWLLRTH